MGWLLAGAVAALALCPAPAMAGLTQSFEASGTISGSPGSNTADGEADFTTSAGQIQIRLANLLGASVIRSSGQAINGVSFTLSNAPGTDGSNSTSGQLGNLNGNTVTYISGNPDRFIGIGGGSLSVNQNTVSTVLGGGQPSDLVVPYIVNGGTYSNGNGQIGNFNPLTIGPAKITLNLTGVTALTTVSNVTIYFGTGSDSLAASPISSPKDVLTPEPSTFAGAAMAVLFGLGYGWRRSRPKTS
jgi:hypothetical protein